MINNKLELKKAAYYLVKIGITKEETQQLINLSKNKENDIRNHTIK